MMDKLEEERIEGRLCEKGFLKERYDEKSGELVREFTDKGTASVRELLKDPKYREEARMFLEKKGLSKNQIDEILKNEISR